MSEQIDDNYVNGVYVKADGTEQVEINPQYVYMTVPSKYVCVYQKVDGKRDSYLYIDGEKVIEKKGVFDKVVDNWPYYIGCNYRFTNGAFAPENFLNGYLDDFILYERILSESEIKELYNN